MPAWVALPSRALPGGRPDDLQKEWQESRSVIGRLDGTLVDLRKYGFGLASGLLTANGLIFGLAKGGGVPSQVIAVVVAVTMLLAAVLFVVDQYYHMIQWGATSRATALERSLSLGLSTEILRWARWELPATRTPDIADLRQVLSYLSVSVTRLIWRYLAPIQYGSFVVVGAVLGSVLMGQDAVPSPQHAAGDFMWIVFVLSLALMLMVRWLAGQERKALSAGAAVFADVRTVNVELSRAITVNPRDIATADLELAEGEDDLAPTSQALALFKPTAQGGLLVVGCTIQGTSRVQVKFSNPDAAPVSPKVGERYQLFVY